MRMGALNVYPKPLDVDALIGELGQVIARRRSVDGTPVHLSGAPQSANERVREIDTTVTRVARTDASVLITGESGTGKERIAAQIHHESKHASGPFVKINCAAIPAALLESELFGHEKGAFTGADRARTGSFERAHDGTIFLDEIGDMSMDLQAKILRAVQEREFQRVGGGSVRTNARIVAASNRNLMEMVRSGSFREDLYYRLAVVTIDLVPLRERADDIEPLFHFFLDHYCRLYETVFPVVDERVYAELRKHDWPGNIRELKNLAERSAIFADRPELLPEDLPPQYRAPSGPPPTTAESGYAEAAAGFDRRIIREALSQAEGNRQRAAELLQIHRKTLYNKMRKLGLE
jgi:two-component system, NtrC family, response regulator AtoC